MKNLLQTNNCIPESQASKEIENSDLKAFCIQFSSSCLHPSNLFPLYDVSGTAGAKPANISVLKSLRNN